MSFQGRQSSEVSIGLIMIFAWILVKNYIWIIVSCLRIAKLRIVKEQILKQWFVLLCLMDIFSMNVKSELMGSKQFWVAGVSVESQKILSQRFLNWLPMVDESKYVSGNDFGLLMMKSEWTPTLEVFRRFCCLGRYVSFNFCVCSDSIFCCFF